MEKKLKEHFNLAIDNITKFGDTDIFPFPVENHILYDKKSEIVEILEKSYSSFDATFITNPPTHISTLVPIGVTGFRWATQLDPFWNAYFLGVTISISQDIEDKRIPASKDVVFSYRYSSDTKNGSLFNPNIGWREFVEHSCHLAKEHKYVVICDLADCYQRIYHHRLENALKQLPQTNSASQHIKSILQNFSNGKSYGLPIGGPGSRILVELVLNLTDQLLKSHKIKFCRFADDYHLFVDSVDEAYEKLLFMSEKLLRNDGLALQKSKTRVMTASEFLSSQTLVMTNNEDHASEIGRLFSLRLKFDPYSDESEEEYEALKSELEDIDIIGLLNIELAKTRVHGAITKRIVSAIRHMSAEIRKDAVLTFVANLDNLYPIFPVVAHTIKQCFSDLPHNVKENVCSHMRQLIIDNNYILRTELHAAYAVRILSEFKHYENEDALVTLYNRFASPLVRRDVILAMANWREFPWLSDLQNEYPSLTSWEQRAFIIASYMMGDAGSHWRDHMKKKFGAFDLIVRDWAAERASAKADWKIPL